MQSGEWLAAHERRCGPRAFRRSRQFVFYSPLLAGTNPLRYTHLSHYPSQLPPRLHYLHFGLPLPPFYPDLLTLCRSTPHPVHPLSWHRIHPTPPVSLPFHHLVPGLVSHSRKRHIHTHPGSHSHRLKNLFLSGPLSPFRHRDIRWLGKGEA